MRIGHCSSLAVNACSLSTMAFLAQSVPFTEPSILFRFLCPKICLLTSRPLLSSGQSVCSSVLLLIPASFLTSRSLLPSLLLDPETITPSKTNTSHPQMLSGWFRLAVIGMYLSQRPTSHDIRSDEFNRSFA